MVCEYIVTYYFSLIQEEIKEAGAYCWKKFFWWQSSSGIFLACFVFSPDSNPEAKNLPSGMPVNIKEYSFPGKELWVIFLPRLEFSTLEKAHLLSLVQSSPILLAVQAVYLLCILKWDHA